LPPPFDAYSIEGVISINGAVQDAMTVTIQNLTKGTNGTCITNSSGQYFYDDIQDSSVQAESGDSIRVCTATSGTFSVTFTAGEPEEKVIDIDYILHPHPEWPYSIEGTVTYYNVVQTNLTVTVRNLTKGTSGICVTDSLGRYFYDDIADSVILSEEGDSINVGTPDGATETFTAIDTEEKVVDFHNVIMWGGIWQVKITPTTGPVYTFQSGDGILSTCSLSLQNEGMDSFDVALIDNDAVYNSVFDLGDTVEIWLESDKGVIGSTKKLKGNIKNVSYVASGNLNTVILSGFNQMDSFKRIIVNELYSGTRSFEDIITNASDGLLALYAPTILGSGVHATGLTIMEGGSLKFPHTTLYECLSRIRETVGDWVFGISPISVLNLEPRGYTDPVKEIIEFDDVDFNYDDSELTNSVIVEGGRVSNLQSKLMWTGTASHNLTDVANAYDNHFATGWDSGVAQATGQYYQLDLGGTMVIGKMFINHMTAYLTKYPRSFIVEASADNVAWDEITSVSNNTEPDIIVMFHNAFYRYVKITLQGSNASTWAIGEINIYQYYTIMAKYSDPVSITAHGLYESTIKDSSILTKTQAFARAVAEVEKRKDTIITGSISISFWFLINTNELLTVNVPGTPINQKFAVQKVTMGEDTKGSWKESIELRSV